MEGLTIHRFVLVFMILCTCNPSVKANDKLQFLKSRMGFIKNKLFKHMVFQRKELNSELSDLTDLNDDGLVTIAYNSQKDSALPKSDKTVFLGKHDSINQGTRRKFFGKHEDDFRSHALKKREVDDQIIPEHHTTDDIFTVLTEIGNYISSQIEQISLKTIEVKLSEMIETLKEIKEVNKQPANKPATDCADLFRHGHVTSGAYEVFPSTMWRPLRVYCDMETDGGGWTVFQRRCDGSENFTRTWEDYKFGFGNLSAEFWLGNEYVSRMTSQAPHELRIELEDFENNRRYAKYSSFKVQPLRYQYELSIGGFSGTVEDILIKRHNDKTFKTFDQGDVKYSRRYKGGFWYGSHQAVNLNGLYSKENHRSHINWKGFKGQRQVSLKFTEMKFRPK